MINLFPSLLPDPKQTACENINAVKELFPDVLPPKGFFETFRRTVRDYSRSYLDPKEIAEHRWEKVDQLIKTPALGLTSELRQSYASLASNSDPRLSSTDSLQQFLSLNQEEILRAGASCPNRTLDNLETFGKFGIALLYIHLNALNGDRAVSLMPIWKVFFVWDAFAFFVREERAFAIVERLVIQCGVVVLAKGASKLLLRIQGDDREDPDHLHN